MPREETTKEELIEEVMEEREKESKKQKTAISQIPPKIIAIALVLLLADYYMYATKAISSTNFGIIAGVICLVAYFYGQTAAPKGMLTKKEAFVFLKEDWEWNKIMNNMSQQDKVLPTIKSSLDIVKGIPKRYRFPFMIKRANGLEEHYVGLVDAMTGNVTCPQTKYPMYGDEVPPVSYVPDRDFMLSQRFNYDKWKYGGKK